MPCYQYLCECGNEFDKIVPTYDTEATAECPKCGKAAAFDLPNGSRRRVKFLFNYMSESDD